MLDSLQHLLLIAEHGSFTAASRYAHLTQPALTASIQRLEDAMGAPLLHRHARGATPTAAGEALLVHARAALASVQAGRRAVAEVQGLARGQVRIGGGATACTYLLPPVLTAFHDAHPDIDLRVRETYTPAIAVAVRAGELDLGVAQGGAFEGGLVADAWLDDPLCFVASPDLAARLPRRGARLGPDVPVVTFVPGAALRDLLEQVLPDARIAMELGSIAAVKGHVRAGLGLALLSRTAVAVDLQLGRLVEVADPRLPPPRRLVLLHLGIDRLPPAARALRKRLLAHGSDPHVADQGQDLLVVGEELVDQG